MKSGRIKGLLGTISGTGPDFSVETRFLNLACLVSAVISLLVLGEHLIWNYSSFIVLLSSGFLIISLVLYFLSRYLKKFRLVSVSLFLSVSGLLTGIWFFSSGYEGPTLLFFIVLLSFFIYILRQSDRQLIVFVTVINITLLVIIQLFFPELIGEYRALPDKLIDLNVVLIIYMVFMVVIIIYIKKSFLQQQKLLESATDKLNTELAEKMKAKREVEQFSHQLELMLNERTAELRNELSERQKTQHELIHQHTILKCIIDSTPEAIAITDMKGTIIDCNLMAVDLLNVTSKSNLVGHNLFEWIALKKHKEFSELLLNTLEHQNKKEIEYEFFSERGYYITLELLLGKTSIPDDSEQYYILVAKDISFRKKAEERLLEQSLKLQELNATKDRFFSIIAHDLKEPLNAIMGFSEVLSNHYNTLDEDEKKTYIKNIFMSSESLFKLLQNLLEWARSQTGKLEYHAREFDMGTLVNETFALLELQARNKKIALINEISGNDIVNADRNMIQTVIRNLVSNAVKFTHTNGFVKVSTHHTRPEGMEEEFLEIRVQDNGVGISPENIDKIMKLDAKVKTRGTADETGTGLGLILCKEFVIRNRGYFRIESDENTGSTFIVGLPKL